MTDTLTPPVPAPVVFQQRAYTAKTGFPRFRGKGGPVGVWNLFRDGVTPSFVDLFLDCKEQTRLHYVEGWQSGSTLSLEFGNCIHWVFEQAYGLLVTKYPLAVPDAATCKEWVSQYEAHWNEINPSPSESQVEQQQLVYGFAAATLPTYFRRWDGDFTGKYTNMQNTTVHPKKYIAAEGEVNVPYVYPDGLTVRFRGKRDLVFEDKKTDEWIFDTKCLSVISNDDLMATFPIDFQQFSYIWARREETGKTPKGAIKNIYRRPGQRRGNKKGIDQPLVEYFARIAEEYADPECWDQKNQKTVGCFVRYEMAVTPAEIDQWKERELDPIMADIRDWVEGKSRHYRSSKHATGKYGQCGLFKGLVFGDFGGYKKRDKPFPELL